MSRRTKGSIPEINIRLKIEEISEKGWIKTLRPGDTGIGYTLETELGINENNFICSDLTYNEEPVELKAQRKLAVSNITLITKTPYWDPLSASEIIEQYGYPDVHGRRGLKVTLNTIDFNAQGLKLVIDGRRLTVVHRKDGVICYFILDELMQKLREKLSEHLLLVFADVKKVQSVEYFHFNEATYLSHLSEDHFKQLLNNGALVFEFRMHFKKTGGVRDHGPGFRLNKRHIEQLYIEVEELL